MSQTLYEGVLVVDDDTSIRVALERVLRKHGYDVASAATPRAAIALARRSRGRSGVAIIDLDLGPSSGVALVRHFLRRRPRLGVIVFSASPDERWMERLRALGVRACLAKPAAPECILEAVRQTFDSN
jgi:DNA-binding NarL/FixJ family response regulator